MSKQAKQIRIPVSGLSQQSDVPENLTILYRAEPPASPDRWLILDADKKEVVVAFAEQPSYSLVSQLKGAGFKRIMNTSWCWTKRQNAESLAFAGRLAGVRTPSLAAA